MVVAKDHAFFNKPATKKTAGLFKYVLKYDILLPPGII